MHRVYVVFFLMVALHLANDICLYMVVLQVILYINDGFAFAFSQFAGIEKKLRPSIQVRWSKGLADGFI